MRDLLPFSQANPASPNYEGDMDEVEKTHETGGTIGFQPVKGVVVKSVVFSQWTKLLDRFVFRDCSAALTDELCSVGDALDDSQIKYGRLDGSMSRDQRTVAMDNFRLDPSSEILLVSLRAGGVGSVARILRSYCH